MKKLLALSVFSCLFICGYSQDFTGKKAIRGNVSLLSDLNTVEYNGAETNNNNFGFLISPLYGKFSKSKLLTLGIVIRYGAQKNEYSNGSWQKSKGYGIGPAINYQSFKVLANRIFYSPAIDFYITYGNQKVNSNTNTAQGNERIILSSFSFVPLSFSYQLSNRIILSSMLGNIQLQYRDVKSTSSGATISANTKNFNFQLNGNGLVGASCIFLLN